MPILSSGDMTRIVIRVLGIDNLSNCDLLRLTNACFKVIRYQYIIGFNGKNLQFFMYYVMIVIITKIYPGIGKWACFIMVKCFLGANQMNQHYPRSGVLKYISWWVMKDQREFKDGFPGSK